jgi:hypothetical protein
MGWLGSRLVQLDIIARLLLNDEQHVHIEFNYE